jgi:hypothetical protein
MSLGIIVSKFGSVVVEWPQDKLDSALSELRAERRKQAVVAQGEYFNTCCDYAAGLINNLEKACQLLWDDKGDINGVPALLDAVTTTHEYLTQVKCYLESIPVRTHQPTE